MKALKINNQNGQVNGTGRNSVHGMEWNGIGLGSVAYCGG